MNAPPAITRYRSHPAMELAVFGAGIFMGYTALQETGTLRCAWNAFLFLMLLLFWLSMQRVEVSADAVVVSRRFGLFRRRIPMRNITDGVSRLLPGWRGGYPQLLIHVSGERPCDVNLFSHGRHLRVLRHVRSQLARITDSAAGGAPPGRVQASGK